MGNKMGIEAGYDFSDKNETEEKIPDLNQMEPVVYYSESSASLYDKRYGTVRVP